MKNPVSVVTGGLSGIGAACVRALVNRGDQVIVLDITTDSTLVNDIADKLILHECDVTNDDQMREVADKIAAEHGPINNLVNSAGIIQKPVAPDELDMRTWDQIVNVDQRGTYLACLLYGQQMVKAGQGAIVNIASIAGIRSVPLHSYGPAKAAVIAMTQCLASEWGRAGVRVNSVSPGYTLTPALQDAIDKGQRDVSALEKYTALGRMVKPEEIADAVSFLTSRAAAAITGVDLPVDAGWLVGNGWGTYGGVREPRR
ncbi:MAG TPA: SDR family oxidoreductase [Burkholderiaceae bacterium]|nr:SDR family oxidoreductase [Burkholderiaceae bacterium]